MQYKYKCKPWLHLFNHFKQTTQYYKILSAACHTKHFFRKASINFQKNSEKVGINTKQIMYKYQKNNAH